MIDENIYGCDYNSQGLVTSEGDISIVEGYDNANQAIHNQILTRIGDYSSMDNEYGSRVHEILGEDITKNNLEKLKVHLKNALFKQERVKEIILIKPTVTIDKKVNIQLIVELVDGSEQEYNIKV